MLEFAKLLERRVVYAFLRPSAEETICDIGCGVGLHLEKIASSHSNCLALDIDRTKIEVARWINHDSPCEFQVADATCLPYRSAAFDKILSCCALEHIEDDRRVLSEMSRVIKRNGILVLTVDSFAGQENDPLMKLHRKRNRVTRYYTLPDLQAKLSEAHLQIERAQFYVSSPLCCTFFRIGISHPAFSRLLFPIAYFASIISEEPTGHADAGYHLCIRASRQ